MLRAWVYDDEVRKGISGVRVEGIGKKLVNSKEGPTTFEQPKMTIDKLLENGNMLVQEQENVKPVQQAEKYLSEAAVGEANEDFHQTRRLLRLVFPKERCFHCTNFRLIPDYQRAQPVPVHRISELILLHI